MASRTHRKQRHSIERRRRAINKSNYQENATYIIGGFEIMTENENEIHVKFDDYEGIYKIPKSEIADDRFGIGRTRPRKGSGLSVVSKFFHEFLRHDLKVISDK